jgi:hypothetical protein
MGISFWATEDDVRAAEELGREARRRVMGARGGRGEPFVETFGGRLRRSI